MWCDLLVFDVRLLVGNMVIYGGFKFGKFIVLQIFIFLVVSLYLLYEVSFYCLDYGGGQLWVLQDLVYVGSVVLVLEFECICCIFGEFE